MSLIGAFVAGFSAVFFLVGWLFTIACYLVGFALALAVICAIVVCVVLALGYMFDLWEFGPQEDDHITSSGLRIPRRADFDRH